MPSELSEPKDDEAELWSCQGRAPGGFYVYVGCRGDSFVFWGTVFGKICGESLREVLILFLLRSRLAVLDQILCSM